MRSQRRKLRRVMRKLRRVMRKLQLQKEEEENALQDFFLLIIGDVLLCVCMLVLHTYTFPYTHQGGIPLALLLVHSYKTTTPAAPKKAANKKGGGCAKKPKKG